MPLRTQICNLCGVRVLTAITQLRAQGSDPSYSSDGTLAGCSLSSPALGAPSPRTDLLMLSWKLKLGWPIFKYPQHSSLYQKKLDLAQPRGANGLWPACASQTVLDTWVPCLPWKQSRGAPSFSPPHSLPIFRGGLEYWLNPHRLFTKMAPMVPLKLLGAGMSLSAGTKLGIFKRASGGLFHHLKGKVNDPLGPPCMFLEPREKGEKQTMKSPQSWGWKDSKNLRPQNNYSCTCLLHTGAVTCWVSGPGAWWSIYFPKAQHLTVVHPFLFLSLAVLLVLAKKWKEGYLEAFK